MGCFSSKDPEESKLEKIEKQVLKDAKAKVIAESKIRRILLLGPGEAGKSTFLKQMIINHRGGFSTEEKRFAVGKIRGNLVEGIKELVKYVGKELSKPEKGGLEIAAASKPHVDLLNSMELPEEWKDVPAVKTAITTLWSDPAVKEAWARRSQVVQVSESLEYFIARLDLVTKPDYLPTNEDLLFMRVRTIGVHREMFTMEDSKMELIDVGGQRNERRKWINLFDEVTAILFLIAVSEYDQTIWEDEKTNKMTEAMDVFNEIANNPILREVPMCVFMNKSDLFEKKFKKVSLKVAFPDWDEKNDGNLKEAYAFLENKFRSLSRFKDRQLSFFQTTATNSDNVKALWADVQLQILNKNLDQLSF